MNERDRAEALMRQRLAREQQQAQRNYQLPPNGLPTNPPVSTRSQPMPVPPNSIGGAKVPFPRPDPNPPVGKITGAGPGFTPARSDPTNKYHNLEKATGEPGMSMGMAEGFTGGSVNTSLFLIIVALLIATVFVLPPSFRAYWLAIIGLSGLTMLLFALYKEWVRVSQDATKPASDREKYASWAMIILYSMNVLYTIVVACLLLVMIWKIYGIVIQRSTLLGRYEKEVEGRNSLKKRKAPMMM